MMLIQSILKGFVHQDQGMKLQDSASKARWGTVYAQAVADGAGSYRDTDVGARVMARYMSQWAARSFRRLREMTDREAAEAAVDEISRTLEALRAAKPGCWHNDFASTLILCAMDAQTGEYVGFHLGDGLLAAHVGDGRFVRLTEPAQKDADDECRATVLTTSPIRQQLDTIRVVRGRTDVLLLATDGAENKLYRPEEKTVSAGTRAILDLVCGTNPERIEERLGKALRSAYLPMDDLTVGLIVRPLTPDAVWLGWKSDRPLSERRRLRAFETYAKSRESGETVRLAARRAGWGRRNRTRKVEQAGRYNIL